MALFASALKQWLPLPCFFRSFSAKSVQNFVHTPIGAAVLSTLCLSKKGTTVLSRTNYQKIFYNSDVLAASQLNSKRHEIHCIFDYLLRQNEGILHPRSPMRSTKKNKK